MAVNINVVYDDKSSDSFSFKLPAARKTFLQRHRATTAILCELKRCIASKRNIAPLSQSLRFSQSTSFDDILSSSVYPTVFCSIRQRAPSNTITVSSWNKDDYALAIDRNDSVIDLKFLLATAISSLPEHIHLVRDFTVRIFANAQRLTDAGLLSDSKTRINYWLELPQSDTAHPNEFVIRSQPNLLSVPAHMTNVGRCFRHYAAQFPHNPHLGTRKWNLTNDARGDYEYLTLGEVAQNVSYLATAFVRKLKLPAGTKMGICAMNRTEWAFADYAGHCQSFCTVPLYDTLSKNAIEYIVKHASLEIIVCNKETLCEVVKAQKVCPSLKHIVLMDLQSADQQWMKENGQKENGWTVTMSELLAFGKGEIDAGKGVKDNFADAESFCTICYTSGTTGDPKGVLLTHTALLTTVESLKTKLSDFVDADSVHISYLPLAHMYEKLVHLIVLVKGARIGYWSGDTLTLLDDIATVRPTVFMGVPRVYQKFQDKILAGVNEANFVRKWLFNKAYASKVASLASGSEPSALWEKLVFSKVKEKFGGRIKACVSGSAPLSSSTANFLKICFCDIVAEGYGLTETSAAGTGTEQDDNTYGQVGAVGSAVEMKLVGVADMNYTLDDEPMPRGEIWFRGPSVFSGYYRNQQKTAEVLGKDGWFATGDIGQWRLDGKLQIIDRKKNIFKLAQGEYIRPEYIENVYKLSALVGNIFVHGDSSETYLVGVVWPDMEVLANWCKGHGLGHIAGDVKAIATNEKVLAAIRADMNKVAQREELLGFEKVKRIHLVAEDFSIENGLLTATMKLKRKVARDRYEKAIAAMYAQAAKSKL